MKKDRSHIRELEQIVLKSCQFKEWDKAVEAARKVLSEEPDNLLALSNKTFALWFVEQAADEDDKAIIKHERLSGARKVVEMTEPLINSPALGVYTQGGQEVIMSRQAALNALAWDYYETGTTKEEFEEGLEYIDLAIAVPDIKANHPIKDTKVRLLLKLERHDEAYFMTRDILSQDPTFADIKDIKDSEGYQAWLERTKITYTPEEAHEVMGPPEGSIARLISRFAEARDEVEVLPDIYHDMTDLLSPELKAYAQTLASHDVGSQLHYLDLQQPDLPSFSYMLQTQDGLWIGRLRGFFCGTSIIATGNEETYAATWDTVHTNVSHSTSSEPTGHSRVFYTHQDDWGIFHSYPSISAFLYSQLQQDEDELQDKRYYGDEAHRFDAALEAFKAERKADIKRGQDSKIPTGFTHNMLSPRTDPERLNPRIDWIVHLFMGIGDRHEAMAAMPLFHDMENERPAIQRWPHIAAYWLLHHMALDNIEHLDNILGLTMGHTHPALVEIRDVARSITDHRVGISASPINLLLPDMGPTSPKDPDFVPSVSWWDQTRVQGFQEDMYEHAKAGELGPREPSRPNTPKALKDLFHSFGRS